MIDNIGTPQWVNLAFSDNSTISSADGEILVSLKPGSSWLDSRLREDAPRKTRKRFPDLSFYFQPADIVSQILNFGLPAPIDIQIAGYAPQNYAIAREIEARVKTSSWRSRRWIASGHERAGAAGQSRSHSRQELGFTERDVANSLLISLSVTVRR